MKSDYYLANDFNFILKLIYYVRFFFNLHDISKRTNERKEMIALKFTRF